MRDTPQLPCVLICAGGTGGHVFPGLAVARALQEISEVQVVFAGTPRGLEGRLVPEHGYPLELLEVEPIRGGGLRQAVRGGWSAARVLGRSMDLLRRRRPRVVLSVGGYAAGPVGVAAAVSRTPLAVLEPNATMGLTNAILTPLAARGYVAWPEVGARFRAGRAYLSGVPVRRGFEPREPTAGDFRLLVLGGSQGAQALNERVPRAVGLFAERLRSQRPSFSFEVFHQTGRAGEGAVRSAYASAGVTGVRVVSFIDDMVQAVANADVVMARAGAVTVAEIAAIGRCALLIPFPFAAGDHQLENARALEQVGGARVVPQALATAERIADELVVLALDSERRDAMARAARAHGRPNAALDIARDLLDYAKVEARRVSAGEPRSEAASTLQGER